MSIVFVLVPVALVLVLVAVGAYAWAAHRGQFDDLETPALRALHDDREPAAFVPPERTDPDPGDSDQR